MASRTQWTAPWHIFYSLTPEMSYRHANGIHNRVHTKLSATWVWDLVADDVVVGDEQVVADRADRFGLTACPRSWA